MSLIPVPIRNQVIARARGCCEYCRLPQRGQVATFPVDHIQPRTEGGETVLENLALACPHCNGHKWARTHAADPISGDRVPLFNPRSQAWGEHFRWAEGDPERLEGLTPSGRATVELLQLNHPDLVFIRRLLRTLGVTLS